MAGNERMLKDLIPWGHEKPLKPENILYFQAKDKYVDAISKCGKTFILSTTIKRLSALPGFVVVRRDALVSLDWVAEVHRESIEFAHVILKCGTRFNIPRRKQKEILMNLNWGK